jgi:hypothetical protein
MIDPAADPEAAIRNKLHGRVINYIVVSEANGRQGGLLPSKPLLDRDGSAIRGVGGRVRYALVVEWGSAELLNEFSRRVVVLVRGQYPNAFDAVSAPVSAGGLPNEPRHVVCAI